MSKINETTFKRALLKYMNFFNLKHTHDEIDGESPAFYWLRTLEDLEFQKKNFHRYEQVAPEDMDDNHKMTLEDLDDMIDFARENYNKYKKLETWENADKMLKQLECNMKKDNILLEKKAVFDAVTMEIADNR